MTRGPRAPTLTSAREVATSVLLFSLLGGLACATAEGLYMAFVRRPVFYEPAEAWRVALCVPAVLLAAATAAGLLVALLGVTFVLVRRRSSAAPAGRARRTRRPWSSGLAAALTVAALLGGGVALRYIRASEQLRYLILDHTTLASGILGLADRVGLRVAHEQIAAAVSDEAPARPPAQRGGLARRGLNLVLITVDALRADHLGIYGHRRATSPRIDRWARTAVVFERTYCPTPHTSFSIASLLTAKPMYSTLSAQHVTLAATLRRAGYHTAAFFPPAVFFIDKERFAHFEATGYDFHSARRDHEPADRRIDRAIATLRQLPHGKPFFLWVHLFDPHHPYRVRAGHDFGPRDIDRYDGEIAWVDANLGRLFEHLARQHRDTAIALTADHGEAFGEHGSYYHGNALYDEQVRVPGIIGAPGLAPRRLSQPVQSVDIAATLLALAGVPLPGGARATDLRPWIAGAAGGAPPPFPSTPVFVELRNRKAVILGQHKLIHDMESSADELYDLRRDPGEQRNRAAQLPELTAELRARLFRWLGATADTLDDETQVARLLARARDHDLGTIPALIELLDRAPEATRLAAAALLTQMRAKPARAALVDAREDAHAAVRTAATIGAARLGHAASLPRVRALLARGALSAADRRGAWLALAEHGDRSATAALSAALRESPRIYDRVSLMEALGRLRDPRAAPAIQGQLSTLRTRRVALETLGLLRHRPSLPLLVEALADRYVTWRLTAAWALGELGDRRAARALGRAVRDDLEPGVVLHALAALQRLGALRAAGLQPLARGRYAWRCDRRRCRLPLARRCGAAGNELLLLFAARSRPLHVTCAGRRVRRLEALAHIAGRDHAEHPPPAALLRLAGGDGPLALEGAAPRSALPRLRFAALRPVPPPSTTAP